MRVRWRYVPPSLVTCVNITAGLLSISEAVAGRFEASAWFIMLCVLLDKADGTLARLLRATSRFGLEKDSLCDLLTFGVAPAVLLLSSLAGQAAVTPLATSPAYRTLVYVGSFFYVIAAALRLAKFNVMSDACGSKFFFGIPTTVCGGFVASYFLTVRKHALSLRTLEVLPALTAVLALLMVSRLPLPKIGRRKTRAMTIFTLLNVVLFYAFTLLRVYPEYLLGAGITYVFIGVPWALRQRVKPLIIEPQQAE